MNKETIFKILNEFAFIEDNNFIKVISESDFPAIAERIEEYASLREKSAFEAAREETKIDKCINCGAEKGLHHYKSYNCPAFGREAKLYEIPKWCESYYIPTIERKYPTYEDYLKNKMK